MYKTKIYLKIKRSRKIKKGRIRNPLELVTKRNLVIFLILIFL